VTTWHWVRHGPTHEKSFVGWRDVPADLSDTGLIQRVRSHLPSKALVVSSDLIRCVDTANAITGSDHKRLPHTPSIREFDFGDWDGLGFEAVSTRDPDLSRAYWEAPGKVRAPNGESWNDAAKRINHFVDNMNIAHPSAHIIAVAHFGAILTQVQRAGGITAYEACAHKIDNLSITRLHHSKKIWTVQSINHVP